MTFGIVREGEYADITRVSVRFGEAADNRQIVVDAVRAVRAAGLGGGKGLLINGPASIPVAMAIAHEVGHLFGFVAWFDPKLSGCVVAISHDPECPVGMLLPWEADNVVEQPSGA